ncbi:MAG: hypothetical protein ACYSUF_04580 [Planctomycetota bacterium]|jgi:hypothetical protein
MTAIGILNIAFGALFSLVFLLMALGAGFMAAAGNAIGGEDGAAVAAGGGFLMFVGIAGPHPEPRLWRARRRRVRRIAHRQQRLDPLPWHAGLQLRSGRPVFHGELEEHLLLRREQSAAR